ncbi:hypothetical protein PPYR_01162 [Photinus pyralis]|uniref:Uncharacterized protein n=1 Tax=Photinus pyralis TaxID=7054 RepID=A0A5N4B3M1_PHOPY|nr:protein Cep89 homolog isoform X1 [Photinus pyralis]XP_031329691.1 protein Cep89 homolog isoform X1 [Photinus pyralis]XP_031329692.1 protein Cep89 homolog isoform X1 [Photinus pyralis]KAB0804192.1 hypothetical protein PPYR_01162 [Photinus pyralis]
MLRKGLDKLSLFRHISNTFNSNLEQMPIARGQEKPRGKHKTDDGNKEAEHKVYSAQFNGKRRWKQKGEYVADDVNLEIGTIEKRSPRNEEYYKRKVLHLKEKLTNLKHFNDEVIKENSQIKNEYQELLVHFEDIRDELESSKHCQNCYDLKLAIEKNTDECNNLKTLNTQLTQDVNMLKNVVYRLNVQLERYQERLRKYRISTKSNQPIPMEEVANLELVNETISALPESHADHPHTPLSWGSVNSHTLGPLLDAYQESVDEKDNIIQNYELELSNFTGRLQAVIQENETLHKRLTEDDDCSAKLVVELEKVKTNLKNARNENDLLIKKCALKQDKLQEVLQCYELKVEQLRRDYAVVVEQYHKSRTEIAGLRERNTTLTDSYDEFKNERKNYISLSMHNSSINECKRLYEELKQQYEAEKTKMKENADALNVIIHNVKGEKEQYETKLKTLEKALKKLETKHLDMQHCFHEVQLSRSACRKQLHKTMEFAKDLVTEQESLMQALHHRQQENKAVKQLGSDIASRMDMLKNQLKAVQRDAWQELSTVEQRLQDQDSVIVEMKREHSLEVARLKEIIKQKDQFNSHLKDTNSSTPLPHYLLLKDKIVN